MERNLTTLNNATTYERELTWLDNLISERLECYFSGEKLKETFLEPPKINPNESVYSAWLYKNDFDPFHRLVIVSALTVTYSSSTFDRFLIKNKGLDKRFTEFGGYFDSKLSKFVPTFETLLFLFNGVKHSSKFLIRNILDKNNILIARNILTIQNFESTKSFLSSSPSLTDETIQLLTVGTKFKPQYSINFPAKLIETEMNWDDLVLNESLLNEIENIYIWLKHSNQIDNDPNLRKKFNKGYKCLFYGPPGTGKTLTASLLGKRNGLEVYRIDLSQIISKYVGETEKNLAQLFDLAENKDWILFFDEAESLFSKRTDVSDSKDKFSNQLTSYLLQRIEDFNGLVVLATNLKPNIDNAFSRRIQTILHFDLPDFNERKLIWKSALFGIFEIEDQVITRLAKNYKIGGGSIKNVVNYTWLLSKRMNQIPTEQEFVIGIKKELMKEGKLI